MKNLRLGVLLLTFLGVAAPQALAQGLLGSLTSSLTLRKPRFDQALSDQAKEALWYPTKRVRVIVKDDGRSSSRVRTQVSDKVVGIKREHRGIGALAVEMQLRRLVEVCSTAGLSCSQDHAVGAQSQLPPDPQEPVFDAQHLRATLGVEPWDMAFSVGIAIVDSGIAPVTDLQYSIAGFYDFTNGSGGVATTPSDAYGHGTHVAGLIAGSGESSNGKYVGVASGARLIGMKVLDGQGQGYTSDVIAAIDFAVANRATLGIHIINLSLGHPVFELPANDPLVQAVENAAAAGIIVVASAGNWGLNQNDQIGYGGITSPGNAPSALTVGALRTKATLDRSDDEVALFSSRGPTWYDGRIKPDVVAPGQALIAVNDPNSVLGQNAALQVDVPGYIKLSGTSMAAAVASGIVALMLEANMMDEFYSGPDLTPNTVKALLQYSALPVGETWSPAGVPASLAAGAGGVNAAGALALARAIDPGAAVGTPWLEAAVDPFTTIADTVLPWAQGIIWGDHFVTSQTVVWNLPVWATGVIWGDDDGVIWGDDDGVIWGDDYHGEDLVVQAYNLWSQLIVWGNGLVGLLQGVIWGDLDGIVWTDDDGIIWGDLDDEGIIWGDDDGVIWGDDDGVIWGDSFLSFLEN